MEIIANGTIYDIDSEDVVRVEGKRVDIKEMYDALESDIRQSTRRYTSETTNTNKNNNLEGDIMTYTDKLNNYGITRNELEAKVGATAYTPSNDYNGKTYAGSYLCNIKGKARVISELTYQGNLQINVPNTKTLWKYMGDLFNLATTTQIGEFTSVRKGSITLDDLGDIEAPEQVIDMVSVYRVKFADLDLVTFLNETTGVYMGTKLYSIYQAEQKARLTRPSMDEMFEALDAQETKELDNELGEDRRTNA